LLVSGCWLLVSGCWLLEKADTVRNSVSLPTTNNQQPLINASNQQPTGGSRNCRVLIVWQWAIDFGADRVWRAGGFPSDETYALASQDAPQVISSAANIAEGQGRFHRKECLQHLSMAKGSLAELYTLLIVA